MARRRTPVKMWRIRRNKRLKCTCLGYHFPHRVTGGACEHGARRDYYITLRDGGTRSEAMAALSAIQLERMFPPDSTGVML